MPSRVASEKQRHAQELFASRHWLTHVLGSLTDAIIATDADARVRYVNRAAEVMTGWGSVEAEGLPIESVYPLTNSAGNTVERCSLRRALLSGEFSGEERVLLLTRAGARIAIEESAAPVVENGVLLGAITIFRDIADRLRTEHRQETEWDRLEDEAHVAVEALGQTRSELRALAGSLIQTQEQERHRIARELHDDLGQQVALVSMLIERAASEGGLAGPTLAELQEKVAELSSGLRDVSHRLHPSVLTDLGLPVALQDLLEQERGAGRTIPLVLHEVPPSIPPQTAMTLYRIVQEALRNSAKHATGAPVAVTLSYTREQLHLCVMDEGPGFVLREVRGKGGLGLLSMGERARLAGGRLMIRAQPGKGTTVLARVPL